MTTNAPRLTLGDVIADPAALARVAPAALPGLLARINALQGVVLSRLIAAGIPLTSTNGHDPAPAVEAPPMLTVDEAATRLHMSRDWCYRHQRDPRSSARPAARS